MTSAYEFAWAVPHHGFTWSQAIGLEPEPHEAWDEALQPVGELHRWLQRQLEPWEEPSGTPSPHVQRTLQEHPALFRKFAEIPIPYVRGGTIQQSGRDPAVDAARAAFQVASVEFADRFGWLGIGSFLTHPEELEQAPERLSAERRSIGEAEELWAIHITSMRQAVELWQAVLLNDHQMLSSRFRLDKDHGQHVVYYLHPDFGNWGIELESVDSSIPEAVLAETHLPEGEDLVPSAQRGDFGPAALARAHFTVNQNLEEHCSPRLLRDGTRTRLQIFPKNLAGALWLQLAMAIDGNKDYRRCDECGEWFEVSPDTARTNRRYCMDRCRVKAYRGRQTKARELAASGKSVDEIAAELGSDTGTVSGWLARGGER